ncbi:M99 family carboxypeptidase catalytic domain-containing protein [Natronorarus salvus]|uniref:M99 family carboxypeptidase catalytic domain-containing protein n=1 Tax=Natronorarus salvus TaxID=3117733 RepID=UPI002F25FD78
MNDTNLPNSNEPNADYSRRTFMKAAGATGIVGSMGTAQASSDDDQLRTMTVSQDSFTVSSDELRLGERLVVGRPGFRTISEAWDAADDGDVIVVHSSYDAQRAGEEFPIVLDRGEKEVALVGGDPSGSVIDAGNANADVIHCIGVGSSDFRNSPYLKNLRVRGGQVGIKIYGAPNSYFENVKAFLNESHGWHVYNHGDHGGSHGCVFHKCEAWSCGGNGFRMDRESFPHGSMFIRCNATWNGYNGTREGVTLAGYSTVWHGGTVQQNSGDGFRVTRDGGIVIRDAYIESNGIEYSGHPTQIRMVGTLGGLVESCYFNGSMMGGNRHMDPAGHDNVYRGVTLHDARTTTVRDCAHRNHSEGFIAVQGDSTDCDIHEGSHHNVGAGASGPDPFLVHDHGIRTRSNGVIRPTDLSAIQGTYDGDMGIDQSNGIAVWMGDEWHFKEAVGGGSSDGSYRILEGTADETTVYVKESGTDGPTTLVVGGIHGDETSGWMAADLIADQWTVDSGTLVVLPRANTQAIDADRRGMGYDLNRRFFVGQDHLRNDIARAIWEEVVERHDPDWLIDLHSSRGYYQGSPRGVGQAIFPTASGPARSYARRITNRVNAKFGFSGDDRYLVGNTLDGSNPMLVHKATADAGIAGYIMETAWPAAGSSTKREWQLASAANALSLAGHDLPGTVRGHL